MVNLRKAAEDLMPILERWKMTYPPCSGADWEKVEALRQALAQPDDFVYSEDKSYRISPATGSFGIGDTP